MSRAPKKKQPAARSVALAGYDAVLAELTAVLEQARQAAARSVNAIMTSTYWVVGRRIVEFEQRGKARAGYGEALIRHLASDLTAQFGRGFSRRNLEQMRRFYLEWQIAQTPSAQLGAPSGAPDVPKAQTPSAQSSASPPASPFPLPWSHYVRLMSLRDRAARVFYEAEALRGGWSLRQLDRQIESRFYERTALSRQRAAVLRKGRAAAADEATTAEDAIKDPFVLEFLDLKDEYSESDLEAALIAKLETFLLELGGDFTFVGRQRRLRVGDEWYRVDLLFFHRRLRCLVVIDLKLGKFTHADAGQMHLYLNYARAHWALPGENPPVGLILCAQKDTAVAHYALDGLPNKVLAAEYRMALPAEATLVAELRKTQRLVGER